MAPERINGKLDSNLESLKKADMWSIGVILYILICGSPPFKGKTNEELITKIRQCEFSFVGKDWDNM